VVNFFGQRKSALRERVASRTGTRSCGKARGKYLAHFDDRTPVIRKVRYYVLDGLLQEGIWRDVLPSELLLQGESSRIDEPHEYMTRMGIEAYLAEVIRKEAVVVAARR
jgi:hypothetical protein